MPEKNHYLEAKRYVDNARKILTNHAGKHGEFYTDPKYVKMACNTAYTGVLVALDGTFQLRKKGQRSDVIKYRKAIGEKNKSILTYFNSAYNTLHLLCGYDGDLYVDNSQNGLKLADKIIEWSRPFSEKATY